MPIFKINLSFLKIILHFFVMIYNRIIGKKGFLVHFFLHYWKINCNNFPPIIYLVICIKTYVILHISRLAKRVFERPRVQVDCGQILRIFAYQVTRHETDSAFTTTATCVRLLYTVFSHDIFSFLQKKYRARFCL